MYIFLIILSSFFMRAAEEAPHLKIICDERCPNSISNLNWHYSTEHKFELNKFYKEHIKDDDIVKCHINNNENITKLYMCRQCQSIKLKDKRNGTICPTCYHKKRNEKKGANIKCDICQSLFNNTASLTRHILSLHQEEVQSCYEKGKIIVLSPDREKRMCSISGNEKIITYCYLCKKFFSEKHDRCRAKLNGKRKNKIIDSMDVNGNSQAQDHEKRARVTLSNVVDNSSVLIPILTRSQAQNKISIASLLN